MAIFGRIKAFHVQPLVHDFAEDCARLHAAAFPHPWEVPEFERMIGDRHCLGEAAVESRPRRLVGYVVSRTTLDEAEILTVAVDTAARGHGVGRKILDVHLPRLGRHGVKTIFLEVGETNVPALRLYASLGFAEVGRRHGYYRAKGGQSVTAITMRRDLT